MRVVSETNTYDPKRQDWLFKLISFKQRKYGNLFLEHIAQ